MTTAALQHVGQQRTLQQRNSPAGGHRIEVPQDFQVLRAQKARWNAP